MGSHPEAEDVVQEAMARVLASAHRIAPGTAEGYAVTTARNLVASTWRSQERTRRHRHRLVDLDEPDSPDHGLEVELVRGAMGRALARFTDEEQQLLAQHDLNGIPLGDLARERGSTSGAIGARLHRLRRALQVEYLVALRDEEPPTDRCRPVLQALAGRDRRRQAERDVDGHLVRCAYCHELAAELGRDDEGQVVRVPIRTDPDVVTARAAVRELAGDLGFFGTDQTLIATAVSEIARNIVRFAEHGEIVAGPVQEHARTGLQVVARDEGPGIPDVGEALQDGHSTYAGLGLGLPGSRRVMDEFDVRTTAGEGTTITMTKWKHHGG